MSLFIRLCSHPMCRKWWYVLGSMPDAMGTRETGAGVLCTLQPLQSNGAQTYHIIAQVENLNTDMAP